MTSLHALRKQKGLTLNQMAEILGCSRTKAWEAENGQALLSMNELARLGKKYGEQTMLEVMGAQKSLNEMRG